MKRLLALALVLAALAPAVVAQTTDSFTGKWEGTFRMQRPDGTEGDPRPVVFDLTQKGKELTGTAGPAADRQVAIANGKVTTVKGVTSLTFDATQPSGLVMKFDVKVVDGRLKGNVTAEQDGKKLEAVLDVGRAK